MAAETRNHMKNELPFIRPTTPPARPKKNRITTKPMSTRCPGSPDERLDSPQHSQHYRDHDDRPEDRDHEPDHDLEDQRRGDDQHESRCGLPHDRRTPPMGLNLSLHTQ